MQLARPFLLLVGAATYLLAPPAPSAPLRVLRVSPTNDAERTATISVTFDRPVAGSLDRSVDPQRVVRVEPAIDAKLEWRDPVTVTITPRTLLEPDTRYRVTVTTDFAAMDGSRLTSAYTFSFRVKGPTLVASSLQTGPASDRWLTASSRFALVYSGSVDLAQLSATAFLRLGPECAGEQIVRLRAVRQRRIDAQDPVRYRGYVPRVDSLRHLVELAPERALPLACSGSLVAPVEIAEGRTETRVISFSTYGPLRIAEVRCAENRFCPTGPLVVRFSTPVRGSDVLRHVRVLPAARFTVRDTSAHSDRWELQTPPLVPRTTYAVVVDTAVRDIFGQRLTGNPAAAFSTTGYEPSISYPYGRITVEKSGFGTLAVEHVNVDTLAVTVAPVPDSLEGQFLRRTQWNLGDLWAKVQGGATITRIPVRSASDHPTITGVRLPALTTGSPAHPALLAVRITSTRPDSSRRSSATVAVVQVTDLAVHAKIGAESGVVWVTGASDGQGKQGVHVALRDIAGTTVGTATTDARGVATFPSLRLPARTEREGEDDYDGWAHQGFEGYVVATLGTDRALAGVSQYDPDLSPWNFNVRPAWGAARFPVAGAVFTERGIYRPGEELHAKAIVRAGSLGALSVPAAGDSLRWTFSDRDGGTLSDTVVTLSAFGTADRTLIIPSGAPLGTYEVLLRVRRQGSWREVARTSYSVAEYRPPEFLVEVNADTLPRLPGDTVRAVVESRYLFGAPMSGAVVQWHVRQSPVWSWEFAIPRTDGFYMGESGAWWSDDGGGRVSVVASGTDTLDDRGARTLAVRAPEPGRGLAARVTLAAAVQDVNRQVVGATASTIVHPASFYIAAKPLGKSYFWTAGTEQSIGVMAVRPDGERVRGVTVRGVVTRREWHQVHRERNGVAELVGEWVTDTVGRCTITTGVEPATCAFTPKVGGTYVVSFRATDEGGREATTSFYRWATGKEWVPWYDGSRLKVDVIADRERYSVGDTATLLFASPFTDAEAWITVEREGLIEQRRMTLTSGSTTLELPITEAHAPNAFVSIVIARGRSAPPSRLDDPGRPTIRVGYTELRVTPEVKRLVVLAEPEAGEYRPGDSARVRLTIRDTRGVGQRAEVTLWAVDEGVLALTGYRTPDPIDLLYRPRGLGMRLASNMANVAPQIPEGEKGGRSPGGGGGADLMEVLRSRFKTTAFFLGSVITDADGRATASAKLPDNLTTFRIMAVAVTAGDRYGSGQSSMLVTRPLVARAALPRFVRAGDVFTAGTVVNERAGGTPRVSVKANASGIELRGSATKSVTLAAGRGTEVRFPFRAVAGDSATFRFAASAGRDADALQLAIPVRPDFHPRAHTVSGVVRDTATVVFELPAGIDPARSRVTFSLGSSPLAFLRGLHTRFRVYPYYCTEQITSIATPLIALYREQRGDRMRAELEQVVDVISGRQRSDGGIGYWSATDWTSPWLSAYAGTFLLEAKSMGVAVNDSVLARLATYLVRDLHETNDTLRFTPVANWYGNRAVHLSERVASVDFLSRMGVPVIAIEHQLLAVAAQLRWEDRVLLAEVLARRGAMREAGALLSRAWSDVRVEGNRAVLPAADSRQDFYFVSRVRPMARLLTATLAVQPDHPLVGPMVETLVQQGRGGQSWVWNTQDAGSLAAALSAYDARQKRAAERGVRVRAGGRTLFATSAAGVTGDSTAALTGLLGDGPDGSKLLRLSLDMPGGDGGGMAYYYITVYEVPLERPVRPFDQGVQVERWYERFDSKTPIVSVQEGELVRVRLRVTVKEERRFVILDDALPAGLEAVDLSLRTTALPPGPGAVQEDEMGEGQFAEQSWFYGSWDGGWWSPWEHKELRDDRVVYAATVLWPGTYTATYVARATTPGVFVRPPAHAHEMYNPAVSGGSDGGVFEVKARK